jgi:glycosyltransferase involved in cell wall biosynthesis
MKDVFIILTPGFARDEDDTTCMPSVQSFVRSLSKHYSHLEIVIFAFDYPFTTNNYQWHNINVIPFNHQNSTRIKRYFQLLSVYRKLRSINRQRNIIGVLSLWAGYTSFIGHYFSRMYRIKHHCWLRGQDVKKRNNIFRLYSPKSDELIALSAWMQEEFKRNYKATVQQVIPMAIDKTDFSNVNRSDKTIDIIGAGSLIRLKQWDIYIEVIAAIALINPHIKCILCGDGPEKGSLTKLIEAHNLQQNITVTGEIPYKNVLDLMCRSKILLHPSSFEGYGAVFSEALYAGCHCISFVDPEQQPVDHWHITKTKEEMIAKCKEVLLYPPSSFYPVMKYDMESCVDDMMERYGLRKTVSISPAMASKESFFL